MQNKHLSFFGGRLPPPDGPLADLVLPATDVRGELVAVLAAVAADVALEGLVEAVAAHVDGEHDVVQEEDVTVEAVEEAHGLPLPVEDLHSLPGGEEGAGTFFD